MAEPVSRLEKAVPMHDAIEAIVKTHSRKGYEIAGRIGAFKGLCPYILHHHERWDGKGYPDGLSGKAIPLGSRIIAVADTFDAITSDREYRRKRSFNEACEIIRAGLGSQFCPDCGRIFLKHPKAIQHAILQANREIDKMTLPVRENNFLDRTPLTNLI